MSNSQTTEGAFLIINENQVFNLEKRETIIGRSEECDLIIDDQRISRKHAKISNMNDKFLLTDLNSSGGTYVNGKPIIQKLLGDGDVLTFAFGQEIIFSDDSNNVPDGATAYEPKVSPESDIKTASLNEEDIEDIST